MFSTNGEMTWGDGDDISTEDEVVDPEVRVVRFAGDSVGVGGKSFGWFLVPTISEYFSWLRVSCVRCYC